ncbi:aldehyde dehydrogenase [Diplodia corticola]|uniref:Aldehyde dehydrogenase n=1 Tax=Diplodia corticola TaxID=236234 RepID=A0A1J9S241_9PEZI|nr:aldehyde dehydrogenase [Diplodia corticola]OJD34076.1 aldehyde dehydrogenase [Diplodia corticola]
MAKIFLTGATGFIGGDTLHALYGAHPEYAISALVRDPAKTAAAFAKEYPNVRAVQGNLDDGELIAEEAAAADVVITHLLQISGATLLATTEILLHRFGEPPSPATSPTYNDLDGAPAIWTQIAKYPSRAVDNHIRALAFSGDADTMRTALLVGPIIFGAGRGPGNGRSVQVPELARTAVERGRAWRVGRGLAEWDSVHVGDVSDLVVRLVERAVEGRVDGAGGVWGVDGVYFAGGAGGRVPFGEIAQRVAAAARKLGLDVDEEVEALAAEEADKVVGHASVLLGTNARGDARRAAEKLGWSPKHGSLQQAIEQTSSSLDMIVQLLSRITMALSVDITAPNGRKWTQPLGLFIDNEFVPSQSGKKLATIDPATENEITSVFAAQEEDVDKAVRAARAAFDGPWQEVSATERGRMIVKLASLIEENAELFATIDTLDNGKPYKVMMEDDLPEAFNTIRYYGEWSDKVAGQTISTTNSKFAYTLREPLGVVGQIIPWNYPLSMAAWKLGPALACGNTVVIKAAEQTPLSILYLGNLIRRAGFPRGVVNIINGTGRDAGAPLANHPDVDKVAFTGSTATAQGIMKAAAGTLKNITLETGGKSPALVFADADIAQAVRWAHIGIMGNQGQVCSATSRILVHSTIHDDFVRRFIAHVQTTSVVGDPWHADTFQGPQVTQAQLDRVLSYVDVGKAEGATLALGGTRVRDKGYFVAPTVFTDVRPEMRIWHEEVFGPFVVVAKFGSDEEAVRLANGTTYGLGAAVFTKDLERAHRVARRVKSGTVWVNSSNDCDFRVPFGGYKQSGVGRELGEAGLEAYTQVKAVHVNLGE